MLLAVAMCRLAVLLILLTSWIPACAAQYTYNVYPTCATDQECLTLSDIVNEREKYFTSNVTLVFHPGDHSLHGETVSVANVSNLTLQGSTASSSPDAPVTRIVCDKSSLSFSDVSDLHIVSINFVSCRNVLSFTVSVFQDCSFENSTAVNGGAMTVNRGSNLTFLGLTFFTGNNATQKGGAIYADDSIITFSGKATFTDNHSSSSSGRGGALHTPYNNSLNFSGSSSFEGNTATFGGALYAHENNTLNFSGNCSFKGNTADIGGAVYARRDNTLSFRGNSNFEGNTAEYGGAFAAYKNNTLSFSGNCTSERNTVKIVGGANENTELRDQQKV